MPLLSSFSNTGKAKATFPGQAGTPSIVSQASGQVGISWSAPSFSGGAPITDYKIEYSSNGGSSWSEWMHPPSTSTSATVTGLADYNTYIFRVSGVNAVGSGTPSSNSANAEQFNGATGGSISDISNYNGSGETWRIHQFNGNSTFTLNRSISTINYVIVGGGAGGGGSDGGFTDRISGGGGGGGRVIEGTDVSLSPQSYSITIGGGGSGSSNGGSAGGAGGTTTAFSQSAGGGGGGQSCCSSPSGNWTSGGTGSNSWPTGTTAGGGRGGLGNNGSEFDRRQGGGGGGSTGNGTQAAGGNTGAGGSGGTGVTSNISGTSLGYGGGGGGGSRWGTGGLGWSGGGNGASGVASGGSATSNRGAGGGGGTGGNSGGSGSSGVVIVAYRIN